MDDFDSLFLVKNIYESLYTELDGLKTTDRNFYLQSIQKEIKKLKLE
jgi:hypothetical protein